MLIFSKEKLALFSVPKTGTTAVEAALHQHASIAIQTPPELKHMPVYRYNRFMRPMVEKFIGEDIESIAVIREPVSWLGSWYRYRSRPFLNGKPTSTAGISFENFVEAYLSPSKPPFANVGAQSKFLEPRPNGTAIDKLFRYEEFASYIDYLETRLQRKIELPRANVSPIAPVSLPVALEKKLRRNLGSDFSLWETLSF